MVEDAFGIVGTTQAGTFEVERPVAEGGFAVVYRAKHLMFSAPVALKCMRLPDGMTKKQRDVFLEKFKKEAQLLFRLSSAIPEIVRPLQVDTLDMEDGRFVPFLALEWLEGESLDVTIERRAKKGQTPFQLRELILLLAPIAKALARAHHFPAEDGALAIVHRDLKPENMFLAKVGGAEQIKLLDFGVATAQNAAAVAAGQAAADDLNAFSPEYAAPEQWAPKQLGPTGPWTDVWGLTITLVTALTGRPPFEGDTKTLRQYALDPNRRPTPKAFGLQLGQKVDRLFERALALNPRTRIQDIAEFWTELEAAMGMEPSIKSLEASGQFEKPAMMPRPRPSGERAHFELGAFEGASSSRAVVPESDIDLDRHAPKLDADLAVDPRAPASRRAQSTPDPRAPPRSISRPQMAAVQAPAVVVRPLSPPTPVYEPFFTKAVVFAVLLFLLGAGGGIYIGQAWISAACIAATLIVFIMRLARR